MKFRPKSYQTIIHSTPQKAPTRQPPLHSRRQTSRLRHARSVTCDHQPRMQMLSSLLNIIPSYYGVRLAAIASCKQLIDLEKWLSTHLSTYKDAFYEECLKFLKMVVVGDQQVSSIPVGYFMNIYFQTCPTFFKVLQSHSGTISSSCSSEEMENLRTTYLHSTTTKLENGGTDDSKTFDGFPDDIQTEVDSYYNGFFSRELTVDSIIQVLDRVKDSSEKRQCLIYKCMIANLVWEYSFFHDYPGWQLQMVAFLFGSIIKHRLVTKYSLGVFKRAVLIALQNPAYSKMFGFGTIALEQYVDRLVEWPEYTRYVLSISHLRDNRPQLVASIRWRISAANVQTVVL